MCATLDDELEELFASVLQNEEDAVGEDLGNILYRIDQCHMNKNNLIKTLTMVVEENKYKSAAIYQKINAILSTKLALLKQQSTAQCKPG